MVNNNIFEIHISEKDNQINVNCVCGVGVVIYIFVLEWDTMGGQCIAHTRHVYYLIWQSILQMEKNTYGSAEHLHDGR